MTDCESRQTGKWKTVVQFLERAKSFVWLITLFRLSKLMACFLWSNGLKNAIGMPLNDVHSQNYQQKQ